MSLSLGKNSYRHGANFLCLLFCLMFFAVEVCAQTANEHFQKGTQLYLDGDLEKASSELMEALRQDPAHKKAESLLKIILREKGS